MRGVRAHRRHSAAWGHQREIVAGTHRELVGQPPSDGDALALVETVQAALLDVLGDGSEFVEIARAHAAHQHAGSVIGRRRQSLAFDHGSRQPYARHLGKAVGHLLPVRQGGIDRLNKEMAVEAENLVEEFLAKAVHHRHDDDQRRHAEHDAGEGKAGDHRDEAFLAPRAQIAPRQHPLKGSKGRRSGGLAHEAVLIRISSDSGKCT
jgi:hypothetical protein